MYDDVLMHRPSRACINNVQTPVGLQACMRQYTQITAGIASRTADQSDTSTWSSTNNYCQCPCPHRTVSRLNSDWSHFSAFCPARWEGRCVCRASCPLSVVDGILVIEERLPICSWNNTSLWPRWEARVARSGQLADYLSGNGWLC